MIMRLSELIKARVGTRIYLAVGAILILTIVASTLALLSFKRVGHTIESLVDERYPVVEISRDLAQVATAMVALAPRLADAVTEQERAVVTARLEDSDKRLRGIVDDLVNRHAIDRDRSIAMVDRLGAEIRQADAATRQRIAMEAEKNKRAGELAKAAEAFNQPLLSAVDEAQFSLLLGLEGAVAGTEPDEIKKTLKTISEHDLPAYGAGLSLMAEMYQVYGLLREVVVLDRAELLVPASDRYGALSARVTKALREADKVEANPKRRAVTEAVLRFGTGDNSLFKLRERDFANRKTLAGNLAAAVEAANALNTEINRVVTEARAASSEATGSTKSLIASSSLWLILIGVASILAVGAIAYFFVRPQIVQRLARLSTATHAIADGQLDTPVDASGADEIGEVARAVVVFRDAAIEKIRLEGLSTEQRRQVDEERKRSEADRKISEEAQAKAVEAQAQAVRVLAEGLAKVAGGDLTVRLNEGFTEAYQQIRDDFNATIARLQETITAIAVAAREAASAAAEISSSTTDLSQRTEEQAASLEETSASMEEISSTMKKNAEFAQQANVAAGGTREVADRGGQVVAKAVGAMAKIEESSRKISDIIGVIDEIARQTNLLALNAAVEAARAGEAGRGFAVVASEVRSLAQRAAQAAKDIKDLITNSNGQVKEGVDLVNRAGSSLSEIVESIKKVAEIVSDIATASAEQASGIEQVNKALTQMDEVTQQNSALVEENAATAKTLEHQAKAMDERVAFFKLDAEDGHAANAREQRSVAAAPSRGTAAAPKRQPVAASKRVAAGGNSGGPVGRMQAALATAVKSDPDWKEF